MNFAIGRLVCKICGRHFRKNLCRDWSEYACDQCAAELQRFKDEQLSKLEHPHGKAPTKPAK
jgi:transposase-like protein